MEQKGLRFNDGKIRYDLLEPYAIEKLAEVFTKGAAKYEDHNWLKGLKWSNITSSLKRHLGAFEKGEDFDDETGLLHTAHIAWNAMALVSHYKYHPDLDDRLLPYMMPKKIGLDIDGVLADLHKTLCDWSGEEYYEPVSWDCPKFLEMFSLVAKNEEFYLDIDPLIKPEELGFEPFCYITSRGIPTEITERWLDLHGFPKVPVHTVGLGQSKVEVAKEVGIDYFIDDHMKNFIELNKAGVCTFLMTTKYNSKYKVGYKRIEDFTDFKQRFL